MPAAGSRPPGDTSFPSRAITIQVPFPPGGGTDVGARIVAALLERELGQPVVVQNRAGAAGQVGWTELAQQRPDGYYIGMINLPHLHTTYLDAERQATFTAESFTPFISQALDPTQMAVRSDSPWQTVQDVIEEAKRRPNQVRAGIVGMLQDDEIGYFQMTDAAGFEMRRVYFDGGAPAITALLGGNVDVLFTTVADNYAQVRAGTIRSLVTMDQQRSSFYPDVPTTAEAGFPGILSASTRGFAVPAGTPEPIVLRLQDVFARAMEGQEHRQRLEESGQPIRIMVGDEFIQYYRESADLGRRWVDRITRD